jgi:CPA2 family monovalent cation:H+ antiporter-2
MEFSIGSVAKIKKEVFIGGGVQVIGTILVVTGLFALFGQLKLGIFAGMFVALSSTAIVLKTIMDRGELATPPGKASMAILVFQDLAIVPMMLVLPAINSGSDTLYYDLSMLGLKAVAIILGVLLLSRFVMSRLLDSIAKLKSKELFLIVIVGICAGVAFLSGELGLSLGLGAFLAGLILAETPYVHQAISDIEPFRDLFTIFFFVSIGMLLDITVLASYPLYVLGGVLFVVLFKAGFITLVMRMINYEWKRGLTIGLMLSQVGEFSIVLTTVAFANDVISNTAFQIFLSICLVSMVITPGLFWLSDYVRDNFSLMGDQKRSAMQQLPESQLDEHLLVVGYGVIGRSVVKAAKLLNIPYLVIELNPDTVRAQKALGTNIIYGDATQWSILKYAGVERASCCVVSIPEAQAVRRVVDSIHRHVKDVFVIARTRFVSEVNILQKLGANKVIPEEFETSISIFTQILDRYGVQDSEKHDVALNLREADYEFLRSHGSAVAEKIKNMPKNLHMKHFSVEEMPDLAGKTLKDLDLINTYGVTVVSLVNHEDEEHVRLSAHVQLEKKHTIYVVGKEEDISVFSETFASNK